MNKSKFVLTAAVAVSFCWATARADVPAAGKASLQASKGRIVTDASGTVTAQDAATLSISPAPSGPYRLEAQVQLAEWSKAAGDWRLVFADPKDPKTVQAAAILSRDGEGYELNFRLQSRNTQNKLANVGAAVAFKYWPNEKPAKPNWMTKKKAEFKPPPTAGKKLKKAGIEERSWLGRWCSLLVDVNGDSLSLWFDGRFVGTVPLSSA